MEKLELKHIAPYLPYGLKIETASELISEATGFTTNSASGNIYINYKYLIPEKPSPDNIFEHGDKIELVKPMLRPLSDLTKDENFDMYMDLCEELKVTRCENLLTALRDKSYYAFNITKLEKLEEFMYKNHFDWKYNLLDHNLAIPITNP